MRQGLWTEVGWCGDTGYAGLGRGARDTGTLVNIVAAACRTGTGEAGTQGRWRCTIRKACLARPAATAPAI